MKILVIEDEPSVVSVLRRGLSEAGHEVSVALDGNTGYEMIQSLSADLVLMDVMLPGKNGIDLLRQIRADKIEVPVILLTALGMTENVVNGLNNGADDYISKPFKLDELLARITAVARRSKNRSADPGQLRIADLIMNTTSKTVIRNEVKINLTATEFKLLEFLLRQQGRVYSRIELLEHVWGLSFDTSTNVVDVYINYLRKKIDQGFDVKLIHTVVGMGYVLRTE